MHDIEINKSFRLLVLFGNGYKASTGVLIMPAAIYTLYTDVLFKLIKD